MHGWPPVWLDRIWPNKEICCSFNISKVADSKQVKQGSATQWYFPLHSKWVFSTLGLVWRRNKQATTSVILNRASRVERPLDSSSKVVTSLEKDVKTFCFHICKVNFVSMFCIHGASHNKESFIIKGFKEVCRGFEPRIFCLKHFSVITAEPSCLVSEKHEKAILLLKCSIIHLFQQLTYIGG